MGDPKKEKFVPEKASAEHAKVSVKWKGRQSDMTRNLIGLWHREGHGEWGPGPLEIMTRVQDFNTPEVNGPSGPVMVPAQSLVSFSAQRYRPVDAETSDVIEFVSVDSRMFLRGADIFLVRMGMPERDSEEG